MIKALSILVITSLCAACLLTPPLYSLLLSVNPDLPWPYSRVFDRVIMLCAAVMLFVLRKEFSLGSLTLQLKSWSQKRSKLLLLTGCILSALTSLAFLPGIIGNGEIIWREDPPAFFPYRAVKLFFGAVIISLIEESFFRVILLNKLKERFAFLWAALLCSLVYAVVHFIAPVKSWSYPGFSLLIGFEYLTEVFERIFSIEILPALAGLILVGMVLCTAIHLTRSFYLCVGLHMGWVAAVKISSYLTTAAPGFNYSSVVGRRYFLVAEPVVWLSILLVGLFVLVVYRFSSGLKDDAERD